LAVGRVVRAAAEAPEGLEAAPPLRHPPPAVARSPGPRPRGLAGMDGSISNVEGLRVAAWRMEGKLRPGQRKRKPALQASFKRRLRGFKPDRRTEGGGR
jgi:hypothetical protein